jgi:hypothetical protein
MKNATLLVLICLATAIQVCGQPNKSAGYKSGLIYGKNNAYYINAPDGWVLDNKSGVSQGLYAVLYPKGSTWENSIGIMYSKAIAKNSNIKSIEAYVRNDLEDFKKQAPNIEAVLKQELRLDSNKVAKIYEWSGDNFGNIESTAYIEEKNVIIIITYNSRDMTFYKSNYSKFIQTVKSYSFFTDKVTIDR